MLAGGVDIKSALSTMGTFTHPYIVFDCREDHCPIVQISPEICVDTGYSKQEIMGNNYVKLGVLEELNVQKEMQLAVRSGSPFTTRLTLRSKPGVPLPQLVSICPIHIDTNSHQVLLCFVAVHIHMEDHASSASSQPQYQRGTNPLGSVAIGANTTGGENTRDLETSARCAAAEIAAAAKALLLDWLSQSNIELQQQGRLHRLVSSVANPATSISINSSASVTPVVCEPSTSSTTFPTSASMLSPFIPPPRTNGEERGADISPRQVQRRGRMSTNRLGVMQLAGPPALGGGAREQIAPDQQPRHIRVGTTARVDGANGDLRRRCLRISAQRLAQEHRLRSDSQQLLEQHIREACSSGAGSPCTGSLAEFSEESIAGSPRVGGRIHSVSTAQLAPRDATDEVVVRKRPNARVRQRSVTWGTGGEEQRRGLGGGTEETRVNVPDGGSEAGGGEVAVDVEAGGDVPLLLEADDRGGGLRSRSFDVSSSSCPPSRRSSLSVLVPAVLAAASSAAAVVSSAAAAVRYGSFRARSFSSNSSTLSSWRRAMEEEGDGDDIYYNTEEVCVVDATAGNGATGECYICLSSGRPRNDDDDEEDEDESNSNEPLDESVRPHACPCVCASLYVHSVCLRVWRQQTKYTDCSVCHTPWTDREVFDREMEEVKDVLTAAELHARQTLEVERGRAVRTELCSTWKDFQGVMIRFAVICGIIFGLMKLLLIIRGEEDEEGDEGD